MEGAFSLVEEGVAWARYDFVHAAIRRYIDGLVAVHDVPRRRILQEVAKRVYAHCGSSPQLAAQLTEGIGAELYQEMFPELTVEGATRIKVFLAEHLLEECIVEGYFVAFASAVQRSGCCGPLLRWALQDRVLSTCRPDSLPLLRRALHSIPVMFPPTPAGQDVEAYLALPQEGRIAAAVQRCLLREAAHTLLLLQKGAWGVWKGALTPWRALKALGCHAANLTIELSSRAVSGYICHRYGLPHAAEWACTKAISTAATVGINAVVFLGVRNELGGCCLLQTREQAEFWPWGHDASTTDLTYLTPERVDRFVEARLKDVPKMPDLPTMPGGPRAPGMPPMPPAAVPFPQPGAPGGVAASEAEMQEALRKAFSSGVTATAAPPALSNPELD